jgi:hypothetical protein
MPRRRRGAGAAAIEADAERGLVMRILLHSPKDTIASLLALAAASAIVANALFLQNGPHPAPMFGSVVQMPAPAPATVTLLPRPRPAEADATPSEPHLAEPRPNELRPTELRLNDPKNPEKNSDPLGNLVKATVSPLSPTAIAPPPVANVPRPPASIPMAPLTGAHRVAAVQRALAAYGYGQLKPTGTLGPETQAAIERFEHERRMPVTGQISERLLRELAAVIGHPVD